MEQSWKVIPNLNGFQHPNEKKNAKRGKLILGLGSFYFFPIFDRLFGYTVRTLNHHCKNLKRHKLETYQIFF
jgi:hypothetical protein